MFNEGDFVQTIPRKGIVMFKCPHDECTLYIKWDDHIEAVPKNMVELYEIEEF